MKSFSHANNIVLGLDIYIHCLSWRLTDQTFLSCKRNMVCSNSAVVLLCKGRMRCRKCRFWQKGYNLSSTQSMVLFHVKTTEKKFSELTERAAMGFSMVCVMLQAVYTTAEKEFRTIVFLIFDVSC